MHEFVLLGEAGRFDLLEGLHCVWYFLLGPVVGLSELDVGFVMLNQILPTFLIAGVAHSDLLLRFAEVLAVEEKIRASNLMSTVTCCRIFAHSSGSGAFFSRC